MASSIAESVAATARPRVSARARRMRRPPPMGASEPMLWAMLARGSPNLSATVLPASNALTIGGDAVG